MVTAGGSADTPWRRQACGLVLLVLLLATCGSCSMLPRELNLSPLWFHRLDENGEPLEWDLLWPLFHYERTPDGGDDFRIRPLYRRVTEPALAATEHQFLWPLGRVRSDPEESNQRLFPLWSWRSRDNEDGVHEVDWYLLFPFIWGGNSDDDREDYLAVIPFYADIPQFLSYDRFQMIAWPLFLRLDKEGHRHRMLLWPLIGFSSCAENDHSWFRILPFYAHDIEPSRWERRYVLWPFFSWGVENKDGGDPVDFLWVWPLFGYHKGNKVSGWTFLWPLFAKTSRQDHFYRLNILWPFFHYYTNRIEDHVTEWWLWPFVGHVDSDDQYAWSFAWPIVWWRWYKDPGSRSHQAWILPFFWRVRRDYDDGSQHDFFRLWPLFHHSTEVDPDGKPVRGDWSLFSLWPLRASSAVGMEELYGFLWELIVGRRRAADDTAVEVTARLFTSRERQGHHSASVPFLGSYERDASGRKTLRLLQFLPISLGGGDAPSPTTPQGAR